MLLPVREGRDYWSTFGLLIWQKVEYVGFLGLGFKGLKLKVLQ